MAMPLAKDLPSDGVYAYALARTLIRVSSPATVGLYSSCHNRINMILRHIEVHMEQEAELRERELKATPPPRSPNPSLPSLLALIGRLLFFRPVWTEENQRRRDVRFVYARFSAWHFAGSDLLWAGLVIRLCRSLQESLGHLQLALYRAAQHDEDDELRKRTVEEEDCRTQWRAKRFCCCPLWLLVLAVVMAALVVLALLLRFGFPAPEAVEGAGAGGGEGAGPEAVRGGAGVFEGLAIAALGVPAAGAARFAFKMGKNLIFNQDLNIRRGLDNDRVSSQLGFMNEVRKEMWLLSSFVRFLEVFERRRIRVVLEITNLDRCEPGKIVGVLDAVSILLSEEGSPFITLLALDPEVLVRQVDFADGCVHRADRGRAFLDRIVTLGFTVPPLCAASRRKVFGNIVSGQSEVTEDGGGASRRRRGATTLCCKTKTSDDVSLAEKAEPSDAGLPLVNKSGIKEAGVAFGLVEDEVEKLIQAAFRAILAPSSDGNGGGGGELHKYVSDDTMAMRRVVNSVRVTAVVMETLKEELPSPERIAAWVVLANRWPCRLSWVLQCLEDDRQRAQIVAGDDAVAADDRTLWEVFADSRAELHVMRAEVEDLLEQDGDPEMFEMFLRVDFRFTARDAERFALSTVNLDRSIRAELARIRGSAGLREGGWRGGPAPLAVRTVINMSTEDVCGELEKLGFPGLYGDVVRLNKLTGQTLVFGDAHELKDLLQMTFSEWTTFRLHFLASSRRRRHAQISPAHISPDQLTHDQLTRRLSRLQRSPRHGGSTLSLLVSSS